MAADQVWKHQESGGGSGEAAPRGLEGFSAFKNPALGSGWHP